MLHARTPQNTADRVRHHTRGLDFPPLTLGPRRMHFQYSVALPQIHLIFVSIVEGIALSVLLLNIPLPPGSSVSSAAAFAGAHYAYLPYVISCLLILLIWKQFVHASMFLTWPLSALQLGLMLLISVAQIIAFREANNFGAWLACLGAVGIVGGAIRLNNVRIRSSEDFESAQTMSYATRIEAESGFVYIVIGVALIAAVIVGPALPGMAGNTRAVHWAVLGLLLLLALALIVLDQRDMKRMVRSALAESDLEATTVGGLRYRTDIQRMADGEHAMRARQMRLRGVRSAYSRPIATTSARGMRAPRRRSSLRRERAQPAAFAGTAGRHDGRPVSPRRTSKVERRQREYSSYAYRVYRPER